MLAASAILPGQVGSTVSYTGTQTNPAQQRCVRFGVSNDDYDTALLWTPHGFDTGSGAPVVLYSHGATGNEQQPLKNASTGLGRLLNQWLGLGWAVLSCRLGTTGVVDYTQVFPAWVSGTTYQPGAVVVYQGWLYYMKAATPYLSTKTPDTDASKWRGDNNDGKWGNLASRRGAMGAWSWLASWSKRPRGLLLYGFSAGGVFTLNHMIEAKQQGIPILGAVMVDGASDLRYNYTYEGSARARDIRGAYGLVSPCVAGDAQWVAKVDNVNGGHDPHVVPMTSFPKVPIMLSASYGDGGVNRIYNADVFRTKLLGAGWVETPGGTPTAPELLFRHTTGGHGEDSHFSTTIDTPFLQRALAWGA